MKYFDYLEQDQQESLFFIKPTCFNKNSPKELLAYALGATIYMPAVRSNVAADILSLKIKGLSSVVICLEDAVGDNSIINAEHQLFNALKEIYESLSSNEVLIDKLPLIFMRVRSLKQLESIADKLGHYIKILTGVVFPKFSPSNAQEYLSLLKQINQRYNICLYCMPILESTEIMYEETRAASLMYLQKILKDYQELVLNIRIGATDFSSLFGIRRSYDITIYDIAVIRDCISSIVNILGRNEDGHVISGPVWEYFLRGERVLKPQLRESPFRNNLGSSGILIRKKILCKYMDGLMHEVILDKANGLIGKTVIHPSHITLVQALYVVSHEEYCDAKEILNKNNGDVGVFKSLYSNKMNEIKPHLSWAKKILNRAEIYGVYNENQSFTSLLTGIQDF